MPNRGIGLSFTLFAAFFDQRRSDISLQYLLGEIERIQKLPDLKDSAVAKPIEISDVHMDDSVFVGFAEINPDDDGSAVAFFGDERQIIAHVGVSAVNGLPHLEDLSFSAPMSHVRKDIDRDVSQKVDLIVATIEGALEIARIKRAEELLDALAVRGHGHDKRRFRLSLSPP